MATLSDDDYAYLRRWVGPAATISDGDLDAIHARGTVTLNQLALEVLETRYAGMEADAASRSLAGEVSENWTENMRSLRERINRLRQMVAADQCEPADTTPTAMVTGHIRRR